jgi:molybdopterin converting factor small subunit
MNITVRFFSISKDLAGSGEIQLDVPESTTLNQAVETLLSQIPALKGLHRSTLYAVGVDYVPMETMLKSGDTISFIPPVQGG